MISMIYYVSIITLTWLDSSIKRWQFLTNTLYHPKFECATPKFPSLSPPSLILKGFWFWDQDTRILPCTMFRGPSAVPRRSVVSANNLDREVKRHGNFERPRSFRRVFKTWERVFVRYDIDQSMIYYVSIITLTWRDSSIKRWQFLTNTLYHPKFECATLPNSITFVTFTHPERVLILGSGCKDIALYNVQGSVSSSWQISGHCQQRRMEKLNRGRMAGIFWKSFQHLAKGICEIWYRWSIIYPSSPWSTDLILGSKCTAAFRMSLRKQCSNAGHVDGLNAF